MARGSDIYLSQDLGTGPRSWIGEKVGLRHQQGGRFAGRALLLAQQVPVNGCRQFIPLLVGQMVGQVLQVVHVTSGQVLLMAEVVAPPWLALLNLPPETNQCCYTIIQNKYSGGSKTERVRFSDGQMC